jgi:hypothetical protein
MPKSEVVPPEPFIVRLDPVVRRKLRRIAIDQKMSLSKLLSLVVIPSWVATYEATTASGKSAPVEVDPVLPRSNRENA